MNAKLKQSALLILLLVACKKERTEIITTQNNIPVQQELTLMDAKAFIAKIPADSSTFLAKTKLNWDSAYNRANNWVLRLEGQPVYQHYAQGYRELTISRNKKNQTIEAIILEIIPEAIYLQETGKSDSKTFTGRVFEYDLNYKLKGGRLYSNGKPVGEIKQLSREEEIQNANNSLNKVQSLNGIQGKMMLAMVESCTWIQSSYVDAEGDFTVHSERMCSYNFIQDNMPSMYDGVGGGNSNYSGGGGGGSSSPSSPSAPPPSNLPGENNNRVDPKKMMDCFSQISNPNAAFVVRVYVVEPQPGTSFNVGANSFGHVAISLSKTSGNTTITQTVGFYPTGTGLDKLSSKGQMLDNGFGQYDMSATYYTDEASFKKVIDYVSSPPTNYHFTDFNCSAFVYGAGQAGGIPIPDPTTQIGISGPGGAGYARTPAGMASALREQKVNNPNQDLNEGGGSIPESKGPCN